MKILEYISDKKILILFYSAMALFTGAIIYMSESVLLRDSDGLYVVEVSLILFAIYLAVDFIMKKHHFNKIHKTSGAVGLDWVNSLPAPMNTEEQIYTELLKKLYNDAYAMLDEYRLKKTEDIEFITMWVHEIKTPIAAAKLIIENSLNNPTEKTLYALEDEINKIEDFVQMSLYYTRAGEFAKDYIIKSVNIDKVLKDCIKREYSSINNKGLKLNLVNLDQEIDTDEKWLMFIVKQILDNAIKYSLPSGNIRINLESMDTESVLNIKDDGIGIKEEDLGRIFDKSFTGYNGRKLYNSTGIGLYLSQKMASKLGHFITVASEYGQGTKVSIHFPKWNDYFDV